ncbi:maltase A2-like [Rhagoletis pomonella]|uniref:maltase A2-like n=1 Tax=Rhagoletis pomonella TaxID=28610 RepID=UPI00177C1401|nr:maltase A2-like [Rhagoletis pomonella]
MPRDLLRLITIALLCACSASASTEVDWWEDATLYQIYPRSFMDSDGDGIGDLNGITSRLEYFKEIGVTAAWISPIYESPMADMGYDVANFTNIDPLFGTLDDFDVMIEKAHKLGLKIIMDFVPNHSSNECEWFKKSIRREDGYDDVYVWSDGKIDPETGERQEPSNWLAAFGGSQWTWNEERQQYYLHQFLAEQPDFNLSNPLVRQHLIEALEFWLERGVDSFRIDAVPFFYETHYENGTFPDEVIRGDHTKNRPENPEPLYEWREYLDEYTRVHGGDSRIQVAEAYAPVDVLATYISNGTHIGSQMPMNFNFIELRTSTTAEDIEQCAKEWMDVMWTGHKMANWQIGNHDNGRPSSRIGIHTVDTMVLIVHGLPGASVIYYGDEIGMSDMDIDSDNFRDPERTPMQWDTSENAGFSTGNSTWLPVNPNYKYINVQTERGVARSTLNICKGIIKLKQTAAFKAFKEDGGFSYGALSKQVFQIVRTAAGIEEYRILANFGSAIEHFDGLTNKTMEYVLLTSYSPHNYGDKVDLSKRIYLMPYEAVVLRWIA